MPNYHRWLDRLQVMDRKYRASSLYLGLLMLVAFILGVASYHFYLDLAPVQMQHSSSAKKKLLAELELQATTLANRNLELSIEREANRNMQIMFAEQHKKEQQLERELAFYRSVLVPEDSAEGVAIYGLELSPAPTKGFYHAKLILIQQQKRKQEIKGVSEIILFGQQDGKMVELSLAKLNDTKLDFKFRYFQMLETSFQLPEGFTLLQVKVKVTIPASRWTKLAQTEQLYNAAELLGNGATVDDERTDEKEPRAILEQNSQVIDNSAQQTDVRGSND